MQQSCYVLCRICLRQRCTQQRVRTGQRRQQSRYRIKQRPHTEVAISSDGRTWRQSCAVEVAQAAAARGGSRVPMADGTQPCTGGRS
ncbi:hypothetical protein B296_00054427 [Ensete ventricosum]|uniref:Uncharacterized protein n=1 Tax=Ensete ventricosum TaxID=4639 RepID=A0A426WX56_ENSVE|nr:hypothetical protein B296_00054427 [Ensete ventricosum]